jgi:hypothetical protein
MCPNIANATITVGIETYGVDMIHTFCGDVRSVRGAGRGQRRDDDDQHPLGADVHRLSGSTLIQILK